MCDSMRALIEKKNREHDEKNNVSYIIRLVDEIGLTESRAMDIFKIPEEERPRYAALVAAARAAQTDEMTAP